MTSCLKCGNDNPPGEEYCECGFSLWSEAQPPPAPAPQPAPARLTIHLEPARVRVRAGESARVVAHVEGEPPPDLEWRLAGTASAFATVESTHEAAVIEIRPLAGEPPAVASLRVRCVRRGELAGTATASVEVLVRAARTVPSHQTDAQPRPEPRPETRRTLAYQVGALAASLALVAIAFAAPRYLNYDQYGWHTLWGVTGVGSNGGSPLSRVDFWTIAGAAMGAAILTTMSLVRPRRRLMVIVTAVAGLILLQVVALGLLKQSLRQQVAGQHASSSGHAVGAGFVLSLLAAVAILLTAAAAARSPSSADR